LLFIVDRKKEMIKYKAFSIAPAELEALLLEHPAVLDAAVIGVPDDEAGEIPKGFVVLRPGQQVTAEVLIVFANGKLASYKSCTISSSSTRSLRYPLVRFYVASSKNANVRTGNAASFFR
jgi:acyl-CoA synthetase (AMP-forming)/AMP-acid ligase II